MAIQNSLLIEIRKEEDLPITRQAVRKACLNLGFGIIDQTKITTAASELARNTLKYGGGGSVVLETLLEGVRKGLSLTFVDQGPGISDLDLAMKDGFTTGGGMGLGLGGAKRLADQFQIESHPGKGTQVRIIKWK